MQIIRLRIIVLGMYRTDVASYLDADAFPEHERRDRKTLMVRDIVFVLKQV